MPGAALSSWRKWCPMRNRPNSGAYTASPPIQYKHRHKGLTLIELLVAISVLAFIAVLGWRGLDSIVRARIALTGDLEQTRGMQLAFAQLQSDCAHLADAAVLPDRMPLAAGSDRLTLVRTVFADHQPSRLQVIAYRVKDGVLTRRESAATRDLTELDALWRIAVNDIDTTQLPFDRLRAGVVLQSDVTALTMRLWANGGWHAGVNAPPSVVPTGLEVALQLRARDTRLLKIFLLGAA